MVLHQKARERIGRRGKWGAGLNEILRRKSFTFAFAPKAIVKIVQKQAARYS
jgi:hypothetical protein